MELILEQVKSVLSLDLPLVSNLSNASAIMNQLEDINWCGFYIAKGDVLFLGPFQGDVACTKIMIGRGVCGTAFKEKKTIIVPNVNEFKGHIACSTLSKSEIVTPIIKNDNVVAVIDIDSPIYDRFHEKEKVLLENIARELSKYF